MRIDPVAGHRRKLLLPQLVVQHHAGVRVLARSQLRLSLLPDVEVTGRDVGKARHWKTFVKVENYEVFEAPCMFPMLKPSKDFFGKTEILVKYWDVHNQQYLMFTQKFVGAFYAWKNDEGTKLTVLQFWGRKL